MAKHSLLLTGSYISKVCQMIGYSAHLWTVEAIQFCPVKNNTTQCLIEKSLPYLWPCQTCCPDIYEWKPSGFLITGLSLLERDVAYSNMLSSIEHFYI